MFVQSMEKGAKKIKIKRKSKKGKIKLYVEEVEENCIKTIEEIS